MPSQLDISGEKFTLLTAIKKLESKGRQTVWLCRCDCGKEKVVETRNLRGGLTKSCGCASNQMRSENSGSATHRLSGSPTYKSWLMMKTRCDNEKYDLYQYYGGRGIKYCERWKEFENFYADMGERPVDGTLDRIDINGDYTPENCKWSTRHEQLMNRNNTLEFEFQGVKHTLVEWAVMIGERRERLYLRMYRTGVWDIAEVFEWLGVTEKVTKLIHEAPALRVLRLLSVA